MTRTGLSEFIGNLRALPRTFKDSWLRQSSLESDRGRSQAIFQSLWLHIHPTRVHVRSLRFSATWAMGIASFALFAVLAITGVLLMVYYKPAVDQAYASMKDIHYVVPTGRFIRNIHRWAAHLMVVSVMLHMTRVFYTAAYRKPRELNWVAGMGLFVLTLALSFTGYLLPWDQLAYWAATIGANIAGSPRELTDALGITSFCDIGGLQKSLLLGATQVGQEALIRFYVLHCIVLPLVLTALVAYHFWRIRKDGGLAKPGEPTTAAGQGAAPEGTPPAEPAEAPRKTYGLMCVVRDTSPATNKDPADTVPSWPYLLRLELLVFMAAVFVCVVLGLMYDAPLKEMANATVPENPAKAPWYFLGLQEMVSYSALMGGVVIPGLAVLGLALVPYLDRESRPSGVLLGGAGDRPVFRSTLLFATIMAVLAVAVPVSFGWLRNWFPGVPQLIVIALNPGTLLTAAYIAWSLSVMNRRRSTRAGAIALFTCFLVGFVILTYVGCYLRGPNWGFYWSKGAWPGH